MPQKRVLITLPPDAYQRLVVLAEQEERFVDQQASLMVKRLLADATTPAKVESNSAGGSPSASSVTGRDGGLS
jgi:hypothetical protein